MPATFTRMAAIPDVILVEPKLWRDGRGWFAETYKRSEFEAHGIPGEFPQDNHVRSVEPHVLRGLHYQKRAAAQGKLVRCTLGAIVDVAVDIRRGSPTYGRHVAATLAADDARALWIPPGFAHGYCTLTPVSEVHYKVTSEYAPAHERAIRWDDPTLAVAWPTRAPVVSAKDAAAPLFADADNDFVWEGRPSGSS